MSGERRLDTGTLVVIAGAVVLLVLYVAVVALSREFYAVSAPEGSVFSSAPEGTKVLLNYLDELGLEPDTLQSFDELPERGTIVVDAPTPFAKPPTDGEVARVRRWVEEGNRVVLFGRYAGDVAGESAGPGARGGEAAVQRPQQPSAWVVGVERLKLGSPRFLASDPAWVSHVKDTGGQLLVSRSLGRGEIVWVADGFSASNEGLGDVDNARFVTQLVASDGPVFFDEYHHGYVKGGGVWSRMTPGGRASTLLLAAALLVALVAWGRRVGPPIPPVAEPVARTGAYVVPLAELYRKAGARAEALEALEDGLARALARRHGSTQAGLARYPSAAAALARSAELRGGGRIDEERFIAMAGEVRRARREVEGHDE